MARRKARKTRRRKMKKKTGMKKSVAMNRKAQWSAYRDLQKRADKAWAKLRANVKRKANYKILNKDKNQLLLLLGECNYMARECTRMSKKRKRR